MADELPIGVKAFIAEHIHSVEQLEVLLLLRTDPSKEWSAEAVSREIRSNPTSAAHRLSGLYAHGLLEVRQDSEPLYRYSPRTKELEKSVTMLAHAYTLYRVKIVELIYSRPKDRLLTFADAFRLKKESKDG